MICCFHIRGKEEAGEGFHFEGWEGKSQKGKGSPGQVLVWILLDWISWVYLFVLGVAGWPRQRRAGGREWPGRTGIGRRRRRRRRGVDLYHSCFGFGTSSMKGLRGSSALVRALSSSNYQSNPAIAEGKSASIFQLDFNLKLQNQLLVSGLWACVILEASPWRLHNAKTSCIVSWSLEQINQVSALIDWGLSRSRSPNKIRRSPSDAVKKIVTDWIHMVMSGEVWTNGFDHWSCFISSAYSNCGRYLWTK